MSYQKNLRKLSIGALNSGNNTIVAANQLGNGIGSIRVWQIDLESSAATTVQPYSGATLIPGALTFGAGGALVRNNTETPWMETRPGESLVWNLTAGSTFIGSIWYSLA
jgi:hypothetical protein